MNEYRNNNLRDEDHVLPFPPLPAELDGIASMLDQLGEVDRMSAPAGMESRLMNSVRDAAREIDAVEATDGVLAQLGERDRASAPGTLEDRIFVATRGLLLKYKEEKEQEVVVRARSMRLRMGWAMRAAAGLALAGGVIFGYKALVGTPGGITKPPAPGPTSPTIALGVPELKKAIDNHMDDLTMVLAVALPDSDDESGTTASDTDESSDWFGQYYQLETEGSS